MHNQRLIALLLFTAMLFNLNSSNAQIVHDAEYYIIEAQNGEKWASEDIELDNRLADLKKKHGKTPNIVYILEHI